MINQNFQFLNFIGIMTGDKIASVRGCRRVQ